MRTEHPEYYPQGFLKTVVSSLYTSGGPTRTSAASDPTTMKAILLVLAAALMLLGGLGGTAAVAQIDDGRYSYDTRARGGEQMHAPGRGAGDGGVKLPSWAEPGQKGQSERRRERFRTNDSPGPIGGGGSRNVPLGGLEWLILAGAGYGLFKLRENE